MLLLTHWGRVTHICVGNLTIIASDNGLSPGRRQAIIWTNAGILLIWPLGTNFGEISNEIQTFSFQENPFQNVVWKMAAILSRPQCVKATPCWLIIIIIIITTTIIIINSNYSVALTRGFTSISLSSVPPLGTVTIHYTSRHGNYSLQIHTQPPQGEGQFHGPIWACILPSASLHSYPILYNIRLFIGITFQHISRN